MADFYPELDALRRVLSTKPADAEARDAWLEEVKATFDAIKCVPPTCSLDAMVQAGIEGDELDAIVGDRVELMALAAALEDQEVTE